MYRYRLATTADLGWFDWAALSAALEFPLEGQSAGLTPQEMAKRFGERVRATLASPHGAGIVAQAGAHLVGYILVTTGIDNACDEVQGYVVDWWVAPQHRRKGVGRTLLALCEGWLAHHRVRKVKLVLPLERSTGIQAATRSGFGPEGLLGRKRLR